MDVPAVPEMRWLLRRIYGSALPLETKKAPGTGTRCFCLGLSSSEPKFPQSPGWESLDFSLHRRVSDASSTPVPSPRIALRTGGAPANSWTRCASEGRVWVSFLVLFGRKIDGFRFLVCFGGFIFYQGNPSISPKRAPMVGGWQKIVANRPLERSPVKGHQELYPDPRQARMPWQPAGDAYC